MRISATNFKLALVLVALLGLRAVLGGDGTTERVIGRLAEEFFADSADRILLVHGEERIEAQRTEDGSWVLPDHADYPASERTMGQLLRAVSSLTTLDLVSVDPDTHAEYGVLDSALRIEAWDSLGRRVLGLIQGSEVPGGGASYVRLMGENAVYRAARLTTIRLDPLFWLDVQWLKFQAALVHEIDLEGASLDEPLRLRRKADTVDQWHHAGGARVSAERVKTFLRSLQGLFVQDVLGKLDVPKAALPALVHVRIELIDGRTLEMGFYGTHSGDGGVSAKRGTPDPFLVQFDEPSWLALLKSVAGLGGP